MKKARTRVWSMLLAVAMLLAMTPTVALAAGSETEENYVTLELDYGTNVTENDKMTAKSEYANVKYEDCTAANKAYMALYGVTWDKGYLDVTNREAPLYEYIDQAGSVTNVTFEIHGTVEGFDSLYSHGNQIDCTVGGNHQIFRTSYTILGMGGADGSKAAITDGNVQAYVAGGYYGNDGQMFANTGTLTVENIEFLNTNTTTIAASCNVDSEAADKGEAVNSAGMVIKNCTFHGLLYLYSNFLNDGKMEYTVEGCDFIGTKSSQSYAIFLQNTNATANQNYGPSKLTLSGNTISGYERGINLHNASTEVLVENNEISTAPGYSAVQITACTAAEITGNQIHLDNSNVLTLHELLANYDDVEVTVSNNTIDGNGYLIYDDVAANGGALTSDKFTLTLGTGDTANKVTGTLDTTKGVKGDAATDLIGYVAAVVQGGNVEGKVAEVGGVYYDNLTDAFAALDETNHTLTLIDGSEWDADTPVYWQAGTQSGYVAKLTDALTAAYKAAGPSDKITIVCRPDADVGTMTHGHVADNITLYGNNAYISGGECDLEVDQYKYNRTTGKEDQTNGEYLEKDITITAYELDNLGVWGTRNTPHTVTINLNDCDGKEIEGEDNPQRVYINGTSGENDITLTGCDFLTKATSVYSNADGAVMIDSCSFTGSQVPVNFNHKANGTQTVTVKNSTFTNCGDEGAWKQFAAPIRFVNSGDGTSTTTVDDCTFNNTVGNNGDILIGDGRTNETSNDVTLTVKNTAANVQAQKPGYYNGGNTDVTKMMAKRVAENERLATSVNELLPNAAKIGDTEYATLKDALESLSNTTEENVTNVTIELLADQNVAGFTVDLSNSNIKTLTIRGNGKKLDSLVNGVGIDGPTYCPVINAKLPANATFSVDGIVAPNSLLFDTGSEASLVVKNSTFNESQTGYPAAKNITYQGNTFEFQGDASKYYTHNAYPIWYKTEDTTRSIAFLNNKVTGPRGFHIETRSEDADKQVNIKANGNTFNLSDSSEYKNKTIALQLVANLNGEIEFKDNQVNAYMGVCFFKDIDVQNNSKLTIKNNYTSGKLYGSSEWNVDGTTAGEKEAAADAFAKDFLDKISAEDKTVSAGHTVHHYVNGFCTICGQKKPVPVVPSEPSGSSEPSGDYIVSVDRVSGGKVTVNPGRADKGDEVTVTVKPNDGYELDELVVTDSKGNEVKLTAKSSTKFTFTMPAGTVDIKATFVKIDAGSVLDDFTDVNPNAWYAEAVEFVVEEGLMTGTSSTTFAPDTSMSRAMIWTVLAAYNSYNTSGGNPWYAPGQQWAMVNGVSDGTSPNGSITREQLAVMLWRAAGSPETSKSLSGYADASSVSDWAVEALAWAVDNGIISGMGGNSLAPQTTATRAQVAVMLMQFVDYMEG